MAYPHNFRRIVGNIYAGGAPTATEITDLSKQFGLKYVLSLDAGAASMIAPTLAALKIHQIQIPIDPVPHMTDNLKYLIRNIANILSSYQPIYIHCLQGSDRTGFATSVYRILRFGWSVDQAISEARKWGYGLGISAQTQTFFRAVLDKLFATKNPDAAANLNTATQTTVDTNQIDDGGVLEDFHGFNYSQENFPYIQTPTYPRDMPQDYPYLESVPDRKQQLRDILEGESGIPEVGVYRNDGPIRGSGPVENTGIMLYIN